MYVRSFSLLTLIEFARWLLSILELIVLEDTKISFDELQRIPVLRSSFYFVLIRLGMETCSSYFS